MNQLALAKLVIDSLLVGAVVYLAMRSLRTGMSSMSTLAGSGAAARELRDLEISLKTLLRDADVSSQGLNSSLSRQQRNLEQLLSEISSTEARIAETIDAANRSAARMRQEPRMQAHSPTMPRREIQPPLIDERGEELIDLEEAGALKIETGKGALSAASIAEIHTSPAPRTHRPAPAAALSAPAVNVFGEPIGATTAPTSSPPAPKRAAAHSIIEQHSTTDKTHSIREKTKAPIYRQQRLAQQVEVERAVNSVSEAKQSVASLKETLQESSERSLAEHPAEPMQVDEEFTTDVVPSVAPASDAQQISLSEELTDDSERTPPRVVQTDPRLGVLSSVRRHTQVL